MTYMRIYVRICIHMSGMITLILKIYKRQKLVCKRQGTASMGTVLYQYKGVLYFYIFTLTSIDSISYQHAVQ